MPTLLYRRWRGDMIETYKILTKKYDELVSDFLPLHKDIVKDSKTRGHNMKLYKRKSKLDIQRYSFSYRIVNTWNNLPQKVVSAPSTVAFENRLNTHWSNLKLKYDFTATMTFSPSY